jgi:pimeloyl-ACP methyl ester carboxylesterase
VETARPQLTRRPHLGLELSPRAAGDAQPGLDVTAVFPETSAGRAGLHAGDRLIAVDGTRVNDTQHVAEIVRKLEIGVPLYFVVERGGERLELADEVRPLPAEVFHDGDVVLDEVEGPGGNLRAIFTVPRTPGPHPLVYFLPGAAWRSMEFPLEPDHPVRVLMGALTSAGFATLRLDRSGVGDSDGPHCAEVGFLSELAGYRAGLVLIARQPFVRRDAVSFLGHSLGGMVAPLLASDPEANVLPKAIAVFGTSAAPWHECMLASARRSLALLGFSGDRLEDAVALIAELQELVFLQGLTPAEAFDARPHLWNVPIDSYSGDRAFGRTVKFYQELQAQDLRTAWRSITGPVLALHGAHDWVTSMDDALAIERLARAGRAISLDDVDHQMRASRSPEWSLEHRSGGELSPALVRHLTDWFEEHLT